MQRCIESHSHGDLYIVTALRPHWFGFSQKSQQSHSSRAVDGRCRRCMTALQGSRTGSTDGLRQRSLAGMLSLWYCQTSKWDKRYILIFEIFKKCRTVFVHFVLLIYIYILIYFDHIGSSHVAHEKLPFVFSMASWPGPRKQWCCSHQVPWRRAAFWWCGRPQNYCTQWIRTYCKLKHKYI